jgi:heme-degrading monooxygenase HmoA
MAYLLIHHKVADFEKWKAAFDKHEIARKEAGLAELHLLRAVADPNDVVILFRASDLNKARAFARSDELKTAMQRAGVVGVPVIVELE